MMKAILVFLLIAIAPFPAHTQQLDASRANAFLPEDHWSVPALRRLHGAGLTPAGFDPASGILTVARAHDALVRARQSSAGGPLQDAAADYLARFNREFDRNVDASPGLKAHAQLGAGVARRAGELRVGSYNTSLVFDPPTPVPDRTGASGRAYVSGSTGLLAATAEAHADDTFRMRTAALSVTAAGMSVFAGRITPGGPTTEGGSVVLQGDAPFTGAGLYLPTPARLPGVLRHIGPIGFETMLARAGSQRDIDDPWFFMARGSLQPFEWMGVNVMRAAYAASLTPGKPPSTANLLRLLIGQNAHGDVANEYADNQVVAVDGWFRSTVPEVPLTFYWDWGADDSSGAWWSVAARVFGLRLAAVPGLPAVSVGVEKVVIQSPNSGHGPWYRHTLIPDGWAEDRVLLGHPLGGHGRQFMAYGTADLLDARLRLSLRGWTGRRGTHNVFAPTYVGRMKGLGFEADYAAARRFDIEVEGQLEDGRSWTRHTVDVRGVLRY